MKHLTMILLSALLFIPALAQNQALFTGPVENGGYGGPLFKIGEINGKTGYFLGAKGGWIVNHRLVVGGKGYMLVNPVEVDGLQNIVTGFLSGGLLLEYIFTPDQLVHLSIETMIGACLVYNDVDNHEVGYDPISYTGEGGFTVEPGLHLMLNITPQLRMGAGATYRMVKGMKYDPGAPYQYAGGSPYDLITDKSMSGISSEFVIKIGGF